MQYGISRIKENRSSVLPLKKENRGGNTLGVELHNSLDRVLLILKKFVLVFLGLMKCLTELWASVFSKEGFSCIGVSYFHCLQFLVFHFEQILFGCVAQYTIMPALGLIISKSLGLPPSVSVGLILLSCCPGGTASNVVRLRSNSYPVFIICGTYQKIANPIFLYSYFLDILEEVFVETYIPRYPYPMFVRFRCIGISVLYN